MTVSEFLPPDDMTLEAAGEALARGLGAQDGRARETERSFYDTFDGLVHAAGLTLWHGEGDLELVERDTGELRARHRCPRPEEPFFAKQLGAGSLRDALLAVTELRALLPLADVRSRERLLRVLDEEQKTVVRVALCEPAVICAEPAPLRPRLRLTGVRGYDKELGRVRAMLEGELGFKATDQPLVDEAVRACGALPGGISSKVEVALSPEERSEVAAGAVLSRLLEVMEANLDGTIADIDSEFLHDFRVSVRRTRSVQRELKGVFAPGPLQRFRREFRWLQQVTGDARDLDVYVLDFEGFRALVPERMGGALEPLLEVLRERRLAARSEMEGALRSERAVSLLAQWSSFLCELSGEGGSGSGDGGSGRTGSASSGFEKVDSGKAGSGGERPDAARPIIDVAGGRIRSVYARMRRMGEAIDESSPPEAYHELRKKGKELRYLLELFGAPLFPGEVVNPMVKTLKALQDVLGRHQDREIQVATLHALAPEVARRPAGPSAALAMGALVQRLGEDELAARAAFAERFSAFTAKRQRTLVKETFA